MTTHRTEIASHRGGAFLWPENSLTAIRGALALPAEQVEIDIHASADGEPVVMHDATLDRMTDGLGPVRALRCAELARLKVRGTAGEAVPHLQDALALIAAAGRVLRLEIKADGEGAPYPGLVARSVAVIDAATWRAHTVLMSFEPATIAEAAAFGGFAQLVWLVDGRRLRGMRAADVLAQARACGASEVGVHEALATPALRDALRAEGMRLSVWGANHAPSILRTLELGLDALATDDPPLALRLRDARGD